jgi:predicted amidophosphoribosyltransferase
MKAAVDAIGTLLEDFVSLIYPETCLLCNDVLQKNEVQICTICTIDLPVTNHHKSINDNPVFNDLKIIENLSSAASFLKYNKHGKAQKLLKALKYGGNYEIGLILGKMYGSHLKDIIDPDLMIPLPIHKSKLKTRGYNQSQAICEGIQFHLNVPMDTTSVIRAHRTSTQTEKDKTLRIRKC